MLPESPENPQPPAITPLAELHDAATETLASLTVGKSHLTPLLGEGAALGFGEAPPVPGAAARGGAPVLSGTGQVESKVISSIQAEPECIQSLDLDGNILSTNAGGRQILGTGQAGEPRFHGKWSALWVGPGVEAATRAVAGARNGDTVRFHASLSTAIGFSKYWEAAVSAIPGQDGEPERLLAVMRPLAAADAGTDASQAYGNARFQDAFDQATVGITSVDLQGRVLWANQTFCRMVGYTREELIGRDSRQYTHPDDLERSAASIRNIQQHDLHSAKFEKRYLHRDGKVVWANINLAPVRDAAGRIISVIGVAEDVTERRQTLEVLAASEAQMRLILENVGDHAIYTLDEKGRVTSWNLGAERLFGYTEQEIIGQDGAILWVPEDRAAELPVQLRATTAAAKAVGSHEGWKLRKDGSRFFASVALTPIRDGGGQHVGFTKICRDITARHQTARDLADVQVRLNAALTAGEIGTYVWEIPSDRMFADANLALLFFLPPEVTNGVSLTLFVDAIHADDRMRVSADIGRAVSTGGAYNTEYRIVSQEGVVRWVAARGTVELDETGQATRFFGVVLDITGRKQAEQALAATAQELAQQSRIFNTALSATDDFAYLFDPEGRFLYANRRLLEVWGKTLSEVVGKDCYQLGYPDWHADMHMREIREVIKTRQPVKGEVPYSSPTGHFGMYEYTFTPVFGSDGRVEVIAGTTHDVTAKRRSDEALRESKQRLDLVIDAAQLGTFDWTLPAGTGTIDWNNRLRDFFWLPHDTEINREIIEAKVHPADRTDYQKAMNDALVEGKRYDVEYRVQGLEGQVRWLRAIGKSFRDKNGVLSRFGGITIDVSSQKQAEAELRISEARFRQLADSMPQIVWAARPDGILDYCNQRWFEYVDKTEAEVSPGDWAEYVHPDDLASAGAAWAGSLSAGTEYSTEFRVRRGDGAYRWFLVRALPIRTADGTVQRWYGTCTDIHNQKELQQEKETLLSSERAARTEAERASRMKDEFLSTLSHELRTPLNAILGWAQVLRSSPMPESPASEADADLEFGLATIERNARAQAQIIEDLLDMSRIISGKIRLDVQRVDLAPVVQAAIDTMLPAAEAKAIRLQSILDPQASPVSGDPNRLQQIFWNILSNAIRFTPRDGRVQVILQRINSHLEVRFSDSGEGITPEFLPHVFERFRQADSSSTRRHGGLGLGLAIVKQLAELHGGTVRAASDGPGTGATFVVSLPLMITMRSADSEGTVPQGEHGEDVGAAADEQNGRRHPQSGGMPSLRGEILGVNLQRLRVLVVDDEADARALLRRLLEERGAQVIVAGSAAEAFNLAMTEKPDVLVSDIGMPVEDGYSLIRRIRAQEAGASGKGDAGNRVKLPAVALTAYARAEDRMKAVLAGFQMHVSKPVEAAELLAMVASLSGRT